jgi:hypothetical protein
MFFVKDSNDEKQTFDVSTVGSSLSPNDARVLVGLGTATIIKTIRHYLNLQSKVGSTILSRIQLTNSK